MASLANGRRRIRYELHGPAEGPAYVLVNGLTQYAEIWHPYRDALVAKGFRVVIFDLLGQGVSDKPSLVIDQDEPQLNARRRFQRRTIDYGTFSAR